MVIHRDTKMKADMLMTAVLKIFKWLESCMLKQQDALQHARVICVHLEITFDLSIDFKLCTVLVINTNLSSAPFQVFPTGGSI